jgi:hypothetical protein
VGHLTVRSDKPNIWCSQHFGDGALITGEPEVIADEHGAVRFEKKQISFYLCLHLFLGAE